MSEDIEHCERCNKPFDDDLIDFYEDEEGGGIWCCEDCLDAEIDTPMGRIMGRWPGDETDEEIEKGLASLQRENMSKRNLQEELRQLQKASPDCGVVYNGKSAEEWYTLYCQEVRRNDNMEGEECDVLEEALRITQGDRNPSYGPPDQNFQRTAAMWSALKGVHFEAREVAMFMIALKLSRETHQRKRDNWVDIAGYARCGSLCR